MYLLSYFFLSYQSFRQIVKFLILSFKCAFPFQLFPPFLFILRVYDILHYYLLLFPFLHHIGYYCTSIDAPYHFTISPWTWLFYTILILIYCTMLFIITFMIISSNVLMLPYKLHCITRLFVYELLTFLIDGPLISSIN